MNNKIAGLTNIMIILIYYFYIQLLKSKLSIIKKKN